jgi:hypothetical protein
LGGGRARIRPGQKRARRKLRALQRLRADLGIDGWPLDGAASHVVNSHWQRFAGLEVYRAFRARKG